MQITAEIYNNQDENIGEMYCGDTPNEKLPDEINVFAIIHGEEVSVKYRRQPQKHEITRICYICNHSFVGINSGFPANVNTKYICPECRHR